MPRGEMCVLEGFLWGEVGVVVWGRVVRFRAWGVHCTKHVRVYVSAQKGY